MNNAGITGLTGPLAWMTEADVRRVLEVNVLGSINVINTFLPLLKKRALSDKHGARIINMSSSVGRNFSPPFAIPYVMSKSAIESMSDGLR